MRSMNDDDETDVDAKGTKPKDQTSKTPNRLRQNGTFPTEHDPSKRNIERRQYSP